MIKKIILCLTLILALALAPQTSLAVPTKEVNKKTTLTRKPSKSSKSSQASKSSHRSREKKSYASSHRRHRSYRSSKYSRDDDEDTGSYSDLENFTPKYYKPYKSARNYEPTPTYSSAPYTAGVVETKPLMKVIPQRDGRFLIEPLKPKPKGGPSSKVDKNKESEVASGGRGYNLYEPWDFRDLVLTMAKGYYGTPYCMGASLENSNATDCSGFVQYIYKGFKINLPRSSSEQAQVGKSVTHTLDYSKLLPGDLLFFSRGGHSVGHAGIYLGEGKMIHASTYRTGVTITDLRQGNYDNRFVVAKRVFEVSYLK
jgi:cell wall-associated NlpC family hydrolase